MNEKLKALLKVAEAIAVTAGGPGAVAVDQAVHGIVEHKGDSRGHVLDAAEGAIKVVESIKGTDIADEVNFRAGCAMVDAGLLMIKKSLVTAPPSQVA